MSTRVTGMFAHPRHDIVAGSVVFLVALPLCLGIAVACGLPPVSGLVAGIAGGLIAPWLSRSAQSVTGPAAGLTSIVLLEVQRLGGVSAFLAAVVAAGVLQLLLGALRAGRFATMVPSAVIKGMLAAIGVTIVWKQLPVALGLTGPLVRTAFHPGIGPTLIAVVSLAILLLWPRTPLARVTWLSGALVVVIVAALLAAAFAHVPALAVQPTQFVRLPLGAPATLYAALPRPDLMALLHPATWLVAVTVAVVASLETLLSLQAIDRLDPFRRRSAPDRELIAQGATNIVSGLFGGLPVTAVIVRGGANVAAGARERLSAVVHGILLLVALLLAGPVLNRIPLSALAAVLIHIGLRLCAPALFRSQYRLGIAQFVPYVVTMAAILATDLLEGVVIGIVTSLLFALRRHAPRAIRHEHATDGTRIVRFDRHSTFLSKPALTAWLNAVPPNGAVLIDGTGVTIDHDMAETIAEFVERAPDRGVRVEVRGIDLSAAHAGGGH